MFILTIAGQHTVGAMVPPQFFLQNLSKENALYLYTISHFTIVIHFKQELNEFIIFVKTFVSHMTGCVWYHLPCTED